MNPRTFYEKLSREIDDEDVAKLLLALTDHVGKENKIDRRTLVKTMYGKYNDSLWRKMRIAKAILIEKVFSTGKKLAVGSSSGEGGYWIIKDEDEREPCLAEHKSRINETKKLLDNNDNGMTWEQVTRMLGAETDSELQLEELQPALFEVEPASRDFHYQWWQ